MLPSEAQAVKDKLAAFRLDLSLKLLTSSQVCEFIAEFAIIIGMFSLFHLNAWPVLRLFGRGLVSYLHSL